MRPKDEIALEQLNYKLSMMISAWRRAGVATFNPTTLEQAAGWLTTLRRRLEHSERHRALNRRSMRSRGRAMSKLDQRIQNQRAALNALQQRANEFKDKYENERIISDAIMRQRDEANARISELEQEIAELERYGPHDED